VVTIDLTFGTNENKVTFLFVNLVHVSKPKNPLERCLKTIETCSNMVMFILVFIVYNDDV